MEMLKIRAKELMKVIDDSLSNKQYGEGYTIKQEGYMNLSVHKMNELHGKGNYIISIAHTNELNGDLMQDPEVQILKVNDEYIPYMFRNDYAGKCREYVKLENAKIVACNDYWQKDLTKFMNIWLRNLKAQGFIKLIKDRELLCK